MTSNEDINKKLLEILGEEKGYFGHIYTWGQRPTKYEYIGYELTEDFLSTLQNMPEMQTRNLVKIMNYFEIHANPLKKLLNTDIEDFYAIYAETAWSHFMTVIMFGMLEIAVKKESRRLDYKQLKIKKFLENNLPQETRDDIANRYLVEELSNYGKTINNFSDVVDHLWLQIRSGFIHDGGFESRGLEWHQIDGIGTEENPITFIPDVPMQELLQITWQAILNSYGYKGRLELPRYKKE